MFSCFRPAVPPVPPSPPKGDPSDWNNEDVGQWLKSQGLGKSVGRFSDVAGKELLTIQPKEAAARCMGGQAKEVQAAIKALQKAQKEAVANKPAVISPSKKTELLDQDVDLRNAGDQSPRSRGKPFSGKPAGGAFGAERDTDTAVDSPARKPAARAAMPLRPVDTVVLGPMDFAQPLLPFTGEASPEPVAEYIAGLGKVGAGLHDMLPRCERIGEIFGAAYKINGIACNAIVNRDNCAKLAGLGQDVVRILDAAAKRPGGASAFSPALLDALHAQLSGAALLTEVYTREGWLMHMLCAERMKENFDALHNGVADALKAEGLDLSGKPLPRGDYRDVVRPLRRVVKAAGNGNLTEGLASYGTDPLVQAVRDLAIHLGVSPEAMARELAAVPRGDLDLDTIYANFVLTTPESKSALYKEVFTWYDKDGDGYINADELTQVLSDLGLIDTCSAATNAAAMRDLRASRSAGGAGPGGPFGSHHGFSSGAGTASAPTSSGGAPPPPAGVVSETTNATVLVHLRMADMDGDGVLSFEEFCRFYDTLATSKARQLLRTCMGLQGEEDMRQVFLTFSSFGSRQAGVTDMDGAHFVKLLNDCGLLGGALTTVDADIIFTKAKPKGSRRINFEQFLSALAMCAAKKGVGLEELARVILEKGRPIARATLAENVRLHDDKSTYCGVYAKGGPRVTEPTSSRVELAALLDRSEPRPSRNVAPPGVPRPPGAPNRSSMHMNLGASVILEARPGGGAPQPLRVSGGGAGGNASAATPPRNPMRASTPVALNMSTGSGGTWSRRSTNGGATPTTEAGGSTSGTADLWEQYNAFATFGAGSASTVPAGKPVKAVEMDGSHFVKMCRDCGMFDKQFTTTQADLAFTKVKARGTNKISYTEFEKLLQAVADIKGTSYEAVVAAITNSQGPVLNTTPGKA